MTLLEKKEFDQCTLKIKNENGNRHRQGKYIYSSGKVKEGIWEDGKMISQNKPI